MNSLRKSLSFLDWPEDYPQWNALTHYIERVRDSGIALVSKSDRDRLIERHLIPSLEVLPLLPESGRLLDVGSGGGFPGFPMAIAKPDLFITLIESTSRKTMFLNSVSRETIWTREAPTIVCARVEEFSTGEPFDIITARAVAELPELIEWTHRLLAPAGRWILWKGRNWRSEGDLDGLGVRLTSERELSDGGKLIVLEKLTPRRQG